MKNEKTPYITVQALHRLPYYLQYLKDRQKNGIRTISATSIASAMKLNDVQVRKDISAICTSKGKPNAGFEVNQLIENIEDYLGYNNSMEAVLVGVGPMGQSILTTKEFERHGLNVVAAFETDENLIGTTVSDTQVFPLEKLGNLCQRMHIHIGIIAVPEEVAQGICNLLVSSGIRAIWNFTLVKLDVPNNVFIQDENPSASLAIFSQHLREGLGERK